MWNVFLTEIEDFPSLNLGGGALEVKKQENFPIAHRTTEDGQGQLADLR